jgi:hypothetical protein
MKYVPLMMLMLFSVMKSSAQFFGNDLLEIIGEPLGSPQMQKLKEYWKLDAGLKNADKGIEFKTGANRTIDTLVFSGYGYISQVTAFQPHSSTLPYGIALTDNVESIMKKTATESQRLDRAFLFRNPKFSLLVNYITYGKIQYVKIFKTTEQPTALTSSPKANTTTAPGKNDPAGNITIANPKNELANVVVPQPVLKSAVSVDESYTPAAFKSSIMKVFQSYRESGYSTIKSKERTSSNVWNYKYTYHTTIKIPGEKFNMLYSFPFADSQLDFVSVLEETDTYDKNFETTYRKFEKRLTESLKAADGWTGRCLPNTERSPISDLEFKHPTLGSVVLDYSKTPKGKHILYLRFLPYS